MKLGVNIDHVATLRQARGIGVPDPLEAAKLCAKAGADSIVMHLREDRRHVQEEDLFNVRRRVKLKLNLEMSIAPSIVRIAGRLRPDQVTLVPERRQEKTTEGGLDLFHKAQRIADVIRNFRRLGIPVSLFIDPDLKQVRRAVSLAADAVELHTGDYANAATAAACRHELRRVQKAAELSRLLGLHAYAGHGLDYENVASIRGIRTVEELNIGFSIVSRALWVGFESAVREMAALVKGEAQ